MSTGGLPAKMLIKHFDRLGRSRHLKHPIRHMVTFSQLNLAHQTRTIPAIDIIFLRNVLIYFDTNGRFRSSWMSLFGLSIVRLRTSLVAEAHEVCRYSNATRGNIEVTLTVVWAIGCSARGVDGGEGQWARCGERRLCRRVEVGQERRVKAVDHVGKPDGEADLNDLLLVEVCPQSPVRLVVDGLGSGRLLRVPHDRGLVR
jgi:hypothetical protein